MQSKITMICWHHVAGTKDALIKQTPKRASQRLKTVGMQQAQHILIQSQALLKNIISQYDNVVIGQSTIKPTLRYGSRGIDVQFLQHILTSNGYNIGAIDGIFGTKTLDAVKMLQLKNGLSVDGIVGQKTWAVLTV